VFDAWEIELHGHPVVYRTMGSGPPVVLVHGMVNSSWHWRAVAERLAERHPVSWRQVLQRRSPARPRVAA